MAGPDRGCLCTHTIAEYYAVLTGKSVPRIAPPQAVNAVANLLGCLDAVPLCCEDYRRAIRWMADLGLQGGSVYDALIACAALKMEADALLTLNPRHFVRLGESIRPLVYAPAGSGNS